MPSVKGNACLYCLNCTKLGQLILRKIIKIIATRCQILGLKCNKFDFGWGSAPHPAGRAYSAPPDPLTGFKGPLRGKGKGRDGEREARGMGGRKSGGRGKGEKGKGWMRERRKVSEGMGETGQDMGSVVKVVL